MDIVISIYKGAYVDGKVLVEITKFIELYSGFFKYYDMKNKDMYVQKILKAYQIAVMKFEEKIKLEIKARF